MLPKTLLVATPNRATFEPCAGSSFETSPIVFRALRCYADRVGIDMVTSDQVIALIGVV